MERATIEEIVKDKNDSISFEELYKFFNEKLVDLYKKDKAIPVFDYDDIRYSAMIDFIYNIMPSLRDEINLNE